MQSLLKRVYELWGHQSDTPSNTCTLLLMERKEDPVTPLLFDWSYSSILHEFFTINDNRVILKQAGKEKAYNLFVEEDKFFKDNMYSNYGEVATNVSHYLQEVTSKKKNMQNMQTIESFDDMKKVMDLMPEMKKESSNLSKHFELVQEMISKVQERGLLQVSEVEQNLVSKDMKDESFKTILRMIDNDRVNALDVLRLVILFGLRYEGDSKTSQLYTKLRERFGAEVATSYPERQQTAGL